VPEQSRGRRAPRPPCLGDDRELRRARARGEALHELGGSRERDVATRPDVRPAQGHEEVDVGRPGADPGDRRQRRTGSFVGPAPESDEVQRARDDGPRECDDVARLLARQSRVAEGTLADLEEPGGLDGAGGPREPLVRGATGLERHLLLEDDPDEGIEARLARPERRLPVPLDDEREVRVTSRQLFDGGGEGRLVEPRD
jgi:hypothetical protein